jgi:hypothetical protein
MQLILSFHGDLLLTESGLVVLHHVAVECVADVWRQLLRPSS